MPTEKDKGVSVKETFVYISQQAKKFKFKFSYQWESDKLLFCSEELSFLIYKNQNKSLTLSSGRENSNFAVCMLEIKHDPYSLSCFKALCLKNILYKLVHTIKIGHNCTDINMHGYA